MLLFSLHTHTHTHTHASQILLYPSQKFAVQIRDANAIYIHTHTHTHTYMIAFTSLSLLVDLCALCTTATTSAAHIACTIHVCIHIYSLTHRLYMHTLTHTWPRFVNCSYIHLHRHIYALLLPLLLIHTETLTN